MAVICLDGIHFHGCSVRFDSVLLEEELKSNEVFAKEVDVVEDRAIIECVSRLSTGSTGSTGVKVFIRHQCTDTAVADSFKMIKTCRDRNVMWVVIIEGDCIDCFGL